MKKKKTTVILALFLCIVTAFPVFAAGDLPRLVDGASLLSPEEAEELLGKLDGISERQQMDIVVVTVNTLDGKTPQAYADDFFDYNGYGIGPDRDGILLLVSMEDRDWYISTRGYGITAVTDAGLDYLSARFLDDLSAGNYLQAFLTYAEQCDQFIAQAKTGQAYDVGNEPKEPFGWLKFIGISLAVGLAAALIVTGVMRGQLKSVRGRTSAGDYVKRDSLRITESSDMFLYSHVSRTAIPKNNSGSGGGSGVHISSSGASHGGGGGKF